MDSYYQNIISQQQHVINNLMNTQGNNNNYEEHNNYEETNNSKEKLRLNPYKELNISKKL